MKATELIAVGYKKAEQLAISVMYGSTYALINVTSHKSVHQRSDVVGKPNHFLKLHYPWSRVYQATKGNERTYNMIFEMPEVLNMLYILYSQHIGHQVWNSHDAAV